MTLAREAAKMPLRLFRKMAVVRHDLAAPG